MGKFLPPLLESIVNSRFADIVEEVIFVCDPSSDGSETIIESLKTKQGDEKPAVRMVVPDKQAGLFYARYVGAKAASTEKIFFIDSRITLPKISGDSLPELSQMYPAMCANVDIDTQKNIYCLYWQRSHETVFKKTYKANIGINTVTATNYDEYRIGGTCFYCSRDLFVRFSEKYLASPLLSDDTMLLKDLVSVEPITVHPNFRINWEPRDTAKVFLKHLFKRGPGFAEYHLFTHRGWLFYAVSAGFVFLLLLLAMLFVNPLLSIGILGSGILVLALTTALLAKSLKEFFLLAPLHVGVILSYGFGALRGAWVIYKKRRQIKK